MRNLIFLLDEIKAFHHRGMTLEFGLAHVHQYFYHVLHANVETFTLLQNRAQTIENCCNESVNCTCE